MGLFDSIRRAVGGDDDADDGSADDTGGETEGRAVPETGPSVVDTRSLGPAAFRERAGEVADVADALDGSPASLEHLDAALRDRYDGQVADTDDPGTYSVDSVRFGSYLGTVLVDAHDGEWVADDGWGVRVEGDGDAVTVAVFDVAARSLSDDPVFAAVADRLASELGLAGPDRKPTAGTETERGDDPGTDESAATAPVESPESEEASSAAGATDSGGTADVDRPETLAELADARDQERGTEGEAATGRGERSETPATTDDDDSDTDDPETDATPAATADRAARPVTDAETGEPVDAAEPTDGSAAADVTPAAPPADGLRAEYAETATDFADFWAERELDFSPASLDRLDDLVAAEWDADRFETATFGSDADFDDRAFTSVTTELGSYFGEVLVRQVDGEWTDETDHEAAVVVEGVDRSYAVPVFQVAANSLRERPVFARSYEALLSDLGRDG